MNRCAQNTVLHRTQRFLERLLLHEAL
jgi:hypothetical protein